MRGVWLLMVVGCGSAAAPATSSRARTVVMADDTPAVPAETAPEKASPPRVPRPDLAIAIEIDGMLEAVAPDRRWPLPRAPSLEPHYPIVRAFQGATDPWTTLCDARKRVRKASAADEVLGYLDAWCKLRVRDVDAGLRALAAVAEGATVGGAARSDIIDALADRHDAVLALRWLRDHKLESVEMLEHLAATYTELDRADDARRVNELIDDRDPNAPSDVQCRRLRRQMRTVPMRDRLSLRGRIDQLAKTRDATCLQIAAQLDCPLLEAGTANDLAAGSERCRTALTASAIAPSTIQLAAAWKSWPTGRASFGTWWSLALAANEARPRVGADTLMVAALTNAMFESGCDATQLGSIRLLAIALRGTQDHLRELDPALDKLADVGPTECLQAARP